VLKELTGAGSVAPASLLPDLADRLGIPAGERADRIRDAQAWAARALKDGAHAGLEPIPWFDRRYPALLAEIVDPPIVLWVRGCPPALASPAVAIVGSRHGTPAGLRIAEQLAQGLAGAGLTVVSGMARGIDGMSHEAALAVGGSTLAVLGCGADVVYPPEHHALAVRIQTNGAIVSEFPPGTPPLPHHFPLRNRIISGLARAVVVVEASDRSGSLITARMALEQGRDVLAVPGNVLSGRSRGCHALIKDGARLVETVDDVLDEIGWHRPVDPSSGLDDNSLQDNHLCRLMAAGESYSVDQLVAATGRETGVVLADLAGLELAGRVTRLAGGLFAKLDVRC
jgi:DNA processing protein